MKIIKERNFTMPGSADEISRLFIEYEFPLEVLQDVKQRLADCPNHEGYAKQQLRFLQNVINAGQAKKRK